MAPPNENLEFDNTPKTVKCISLTFQKKDNTSFSPQEYGEIKKIILNSSRIISGSLLENLEPDLSEEIVKQLYAFAAHDQSQCIFFREFEKSIVSRPNALTDIFKANLKSEYYNYKSVEGFGKREILHELRCIVGLKWFPIITPDNNLDY